MVCGGDVEDYPDRDFHRRRVGQYLFWPDAKRLAGWHHGLGRRVGFDGIAVQNL